MRTLKTNSTLTFRFDNKNIDILNTKIKKLKSLIINEGNLGRITIFNNMPSYSVLKINELAVDLGYLSIDIRFNGSFHNNKVFTINYLDAHKWFKSIIGEIGGTYLINSSITSTDDHGNKMISTYDLDDFYLVFADVPGTREL